MTHPLWIRRLWYSFIRVRVAVLSRLPHPTVNEGDRFITVGSLPARGLVQWRAPLTSGFECVIPDGTILVADYGSMPRSTGFSCIPVNQSELESQLVPEEDRKAEKYAGYYFVLSYRHIGKQLRRLP